MLMLNIFTTGLLLLSSLCGTSTLETDCYGTECALADKYDADAPECGVPGTPEYDKCIVQNKHHRKTVDAIDTVRKALDISNNVTKSKLEHYPDRGYFEQEEQRLNKLKEEITKLLRETKMRNANDKKTLTTEIVPVFSFQDVGQLFPAHYELRKTSLITIAKMNLRSIFTSFFSNFVSALAVESIHADTINNKFNNVVSALVAKNIIGKKSAEKTDQIFIDSFDSQNRWIEVSPRFPQSKPQEQKEYNLFYREREERPADLIYDV